MNKSTTGKFRFWRSVLSNPLSSGLVSLFRNPISFLYLGLFIFAVLINVEHSYSDAPKQSGYFSGSIEFDKQPAHTINTTKITANISRLGEEQILEITATSLNDSETVYTQIKNFKGEGTYFIPGDGSSSNIGNLIKDINDYQEKNNFYEATRPNGAGIANGVGRVNITTYSNNVIAGDLVLIGNNPAGHQAILGAAKFKVNLQP
ncbi:MAG: hypothetical protein KA527_09860 [Cytophagaceae bacterium]|nr:hypothetical protein [Cytophagaceae bacterium]